MNITNRFSLYFNAPTILCDFLELLVSKDATTTEIQATRDRILHRISVLPLPPNPLQVIMQEFGVDNVSDVSLITL